MHLIYGTKGCTYSWQDDFPETIYCGNILSNTCDGQKTRDGRARIAFVYHEQDEKFYLCNMRKHDDKLWLHDACSVAIYFCPDCLNSKVLWNQA